MFFSFLQRLAALDVGWFIGLIMNNLLWLFIFYAVIHIFMDGKKAAYSLIVFCLTLWIWVDFSTASRVAIFGASFLCIYYISKIALLLIIGTIPSLSKKMIYINELHGLTLIALFALFAAVL